MDDESSCHFLLHYLFYNKKNYEEKNGMFSVQQNVDDGGKLQFLHFSIILVSLCNVLKKQKKLQGCKQWQLT